MKRNDKTLIAVLGTISLISFVVSIIWLFIVIIKDERSFLAIIVPYGLMILGAFFAIITNCFLKKNKKE